jgi:regulator of protease activity HflC (stomatin/prohibitin superfamily)
VIETVIMVVVAAVILYLFASVKQVRQGYQYTIEHFGRFTQAARPGLIFVPAFFYRVGRRINMMEQVLDIPGQEIITKDNAMVSTDGVVFFQVLDAAKAAYEVSDLYNAILNLVTTNLRTVMGSMDLDETLSKRDEINARLLNVIDHATEAWGIKITRVEIKDIRPPSDIVNAMARQMKAEREKRANILGRRGLPRRRDPEGRGREAVAHPGSRRAQGSRLRDAEAREREAVAEAQATRVVSEAISGGNAQAINYFIAQEYVKAIGKFATSPNAKTILFPVEATQLMGTLGGIGELAREALGTVPAGVAPQAVGVPRIRAERGPEPQ